MLNKQDKKTLKQLNDFISSNVNTKENYCFQTGYKNFGILLVGFCKWLHEQNQKEKNKIFFLARDGYIIKKAYKILYPTEETSYLYVSRRSLALPSMKEDKTILEIVDNLVLPPLFTIDILLKALSLTPSETKTELKKVNINKDDKFKRKELKVNEQILNFLELLLPKIKKKIEEQNDDFLNYLKQEKFSGKVSIVDIGWHNSLQKQLLKIKNNISINGYYIGVYKAAHKFSLPNSSKGYIYSYGDKMENQYKTFSFVSLLETMFLSHEGTTISYKKENNKIIPVVSDYEYKEEKDSLCVVNSFQKGAIEFVKDYRKSNLNLELNSNVCSYNILKFGSSPTKKDIETFGKISFENYQVRNIINFNKSSIYYFTHPKVMINDFFTSGWRVAFLKKLFKIPFPYYYLLKILCIVFKKEQ